ALLHQWTRGNLEHEALNQSAAARFTGRGVLRDQFLELLMQVSSNLHDVFEQVFFFNDGQIFEPDAAGQRTAAEGGAVLSGRNRGGEVFLRQERAERQSRGDRLGDGDDVGYHSEALEGEELAGAAEAALDLVENERGLVMIREGPAGKQKF